MQGVHLYLTFICDMMGNGLAKPQRPSIVDEVAKKFNNYHIERGTQRENLENGVEEAYFLIFYMDNRHAS